MSARAITIHGYEMSGEQRGNLEIKSECPALVIRYCIGLAKYLIIWLIISNISNLGAGVQALLLPVQDPEGQVLGEKIITR